MSVRRPAGVLAAVVLALVAWVALAAPASAHAAGGNEKTAEVVRAFDGSRDALLAAVDQYRQGRRAEALQSARNAYLDYFESVEPTLRVVDSDFTLEMEDRYALQRHAIEHDQGLGEVRSRTASIQQGLTEFEAKVASPGLGAASLAFLSSFVIIFREGLEVVLLLAALLGFLAGTDAGARYRRPLVLGVGAAVLASVATFVVIGVVLSVAPIGRELLEAVTTAVAVVLLFAISFWLLSRLEHRRWLEFLRSRVWGAMATGSALAVAAVGFTAVYREGFETVLFYQALLFFTTGVVEWVVAGFAAGLVALGACAYAILVLRRRLPVRAFMIGAVSLIMLMSVAFLGNVINQLQNLAYLPHTPLREVPRLPVFISQLTGIHPTVETIAAQGSLFAVYAIGLGVLVAISRRGRRASRPTLESLVGGEAHG